MNGIRSWMWKGPRNSTNGIREQRSTIQDPIGSSSDLDPRNFANGVLMGNFGYSDQPYCVVKKGQSSSWLCVVTVGTGREGSKGENVASLYTHDDGQTWSQPQLIEPNVTGPAAYAVPFVLESGRVFALYNQNVDDVHYKNKARNDMMGNFFLKWTNDFGTTWSKRRVEVPYRMTPVDANNPWKGKVRLMWTIDKPTVSPKGVVSVAFTKIGSYLIDPPEEVFLLRSHDIGTVADPAEATWTLLPDGEHGIQNPRNATGGYCEEGH